MTNGGAVHIVRNGFGLYFAELVRVRVILWEVCIELASASLRNLRQFDK